MVRYTGHATLSPLNCDNSVLSEARITGDTVAPAGNCDYHILSMCIADRVFHRDLPGFPTTSCQSTSRCNAVSLNEGQYRLSQVRKPFHS